MPVLPVLGPCRWEQAVNAVTILRVPSSQRDSESACWCLHSFGTGEKKDVWVEHKQMGRRHVSWAASPTQLSLLRVKNTPAWGLGGRGPASQGLTQPSFIFLLKDGRFLDRPVSCRGFLASVPWTCCGLLRSRYGQTAGPSLPQRQDILQHTNPLGLYKNSPGWALSMRTLHLSHRRRLPPTVQLLVLPTEPL